MFCCVENFLFFSVETVFIFLNYLKRDVLYVALLIFGFASFQSNGTTSFLAGFLLQLSILALDSRNTLNHFIGNLLTLILIRLSRIT
jgi:hypothetical protein